VLLAILPPAEAPGLAARVAAGLKAAGSRLLYADCNAVSPATARGIGQQIEAAGGAFVDASLIGLPPGRAPAPTRLYASGAEAERLGFLAGCDDEGALEVRVLGPEPGAASGLKMAYAGLTKGSFALHALGLVLAQRLGLWGELVRELETSRPEVWRAMQTLRFLPADSERWIGEMQEIAATFRESGLPAGVHEAAEQVFRALAATPFARETRETLDTGRSLEATLAALSAALGD
jgi:3-hydroxyisobutyrate dehydrogenase-like beta-hydroxyacid dehydrogenase